VSAIQLACNFDPLATMMKNVALALSLMLVAISLASTNAFVPQLPTQHTFGRVATSKTRVNIFGESEEGERKRLTRDTEPEDFFAT
jgi:hypothetical protein